LESTFFWDDEKASDIGQAPVHLNLALDGAMDFETGQWQATLDKFAVNHATLGLAISKPLALKLNTGAVDDDPFWEVGDTQIGISLENKTVLNLQHEQSQGLASGAIHTKGRIPELTVTDELAHDIQTALHIESDSDGSKSPTADRGGVKTNRQWRRRNQGDITLKADWDLALDHGLAGHFNIAHV